MPEEFGAKAVTPPTAPVRDQRRPKEMVLRWNEATPEVKEVKEVLAVEAVAAVEANEEEGIKAVEAVEAVAAVEGVVGVPAVKAGTKIVQVELRFAKFSSTDEKHPVGNPDGVVSQDGANLYKGDNCDRVLGQILADTAVTQINKCLVEDNVDV